MKRSLIALAAIGAALSMTACGSMTLEDNGRYSTYAEKQLALHKEAQATERARIAALQAIAAGGDDRTRDRIVNELAVRSTAQPVAGNMVAPAAPTHLGLEALRVLGPGAIGILGQGIGAWAQNQADILATQRHQSNNALIGGVVDYSIGANTQLGLRGMDLTGQAMKLIPPTYSTTVIQMPGSQPTAPAPAAATPE